MLEIQKLFGLGARHDKDQVCHDRLRRIPVADLLQAPLIHSRTDARATPGTRRSAVEAEWSEESATRETEGGYDELQESGGRTRAMTHALLGDLMGIHS